MGGRAAEDGSSGLSAVGDRSFDDLADRFAANIWGTRKGRLRLDIVIDDMETATSLRFPPRKELREAGLGASQEEELGAHEWPFDADPTLATVKPEDQLVVLDAGGGLGQISSALASMGHKVH
jgi:S-adenosylmethionine-dependent methyltransferase